MEDKPELLEGEVLDDTAPSAPHADVRLRCDRCNLYVGIGALDDGVTATAGEASREHLFDEAWLAGHCWGCGREAREIAVAQRGQSLGQ